MGGIHNKVHGRHLIVAVLWNVAQLLAKMEHLPVLLISPNTEVEDGFVQDSHLADKIYSLSCITFYSKVHFHSK